MITRSCISINNQCNMDCLYCHFHEKRGSINESSMDVIQILDNITDHIRKHRLGIFKLGFVGNGEPLLNYADLQKYIIHIADYLDSGSIAAYTITNGTLIDEDKLYFFREHNVNVGFSIDGIKGIHNKLRCGTFDRVMAGIELFNKVNGKYPSMNCTVGRDILDNQEDTITFFEKFNSRITFSRMIGKYGITLDEFHEFMDAAVKRLNVRTGGYDCTMYGGFCGAGIDNIFYANGRIYICGNCIDLPSLPASLPLDDVEFNVADFDRTHCYKEVISG